MYLENSEYQTRSFFSYFLPSPARCSRTVANISASFALETRTIRGYVSGSPSKQQLRRALKTLERASLISIQSVGKKLILKCELASVIKKFNPSNIFSISIYSADKSCVTHPDCSSRNCFRVLLRKS